MPTDLRDPHAVLEAAVQAAEDDCRAGRWAAAFGRYVEIIRDRVGRGPTPDRDAPTLTAADAVILDRAAGLATLLGHTRAADTLLAALAAANRRAGNIFAADCATLKRLHLARSAGDRPGIEEALGALLPTVGDFGGIGFNPEDLAAWERQVRWSAPGDTAEARALFFASFGLESGRLFAWLGQYGDARAALRWGLTHATALPGPSAAGAFETPLRVELAAAALEQGDLDAAGAALDELTPRLQPAAEPGHAVRAWETAAQRHLLRGEFGAALAGLERVRALCRRHGFARAEVIALLNRAQLLVLLNQTVHAAELLTAAHAAAGKLGEPSLTGRAARLLRLARARRAPARAGFLIAEPVSTHWRGAAGAPGSDGEPDGPASFESAGAAGFLARFEDHALGFHWLLDVGKFGASREWLEAMRAIFAHTDSALVRLRLRALEAMQCFCERSWKVASALLGELRPELRARGLKHELWQLGRFALWCEARAGGETGMLARENEALLAEMSGSLEETDRVFFHLNKWTEEEERIGARVEELTAAHRQAERLGPLRRWLARWRLVGRLHDLEREVGRVRGKRLDGHDGTTPAAARPAVPWWRRIARHPRRGATISFLVLPDRVVVIRATFLSLTFGVCALSRVRLRELVAGWHGALSRAEDGALEARHFAEQVSDALQLPALLAALPPRVDALRVVPDDVLHGVPFAALLAADGRHVVESYAVSVASADEAARGGVSDPSRGPVLAVGVSDALDGYAALPHAAEEARSVAASFGTARVLLDAAATRGAVLDALATAPVAHFACHGEFCRQDLTRSGLVLRGANGGGEILSLRDLARLDLRGVRHVTVASCWSADNYVLPGRRVVSLPQILLDAGAGSVLGSLWALEDRISARFVRRFYDLARRLPRHEAMRQTQLECLRNDLFGTGSGAPNTSDMCYWACHTLHGETGVLTVR